MFGDVSRIFKGAKRSATRSVNTIMTTAYWMIGQHIMEFKQSGENRAKYGVALILKLAGGFTKRFGRGFSRHNIQKTRLLYLAYPPEKICPTGTGKLESAMSSVIPQTPSAESLMASSASIFPLGWSAYMELILCAQKDEAVVGNTLGGLPNKVMAVKYKTSLPDEKIQVAEIDRTREALSKCA